MTALKDFPHILNNLTTKKKDIIVALHKYVFEDEGDRGNRQRLREFTGFDFREDDAKFAQKLMYVEEKLNQAELVSICITLGIDYNAENLVRHIFKNLLKNELLKDAVEDEEDGDEEDNDEDDSSNINLRRVSTVSGASTVGSGARGAPVQEVDNSWVRNVQRFSLNFRDIEDAILKYDGTSNTSIKAWVEDFEEMSDLMRWDELQRMIYSKRSLTGLAKLFIESLHGVNSWQKIKGALLKEFGGKMDSGQLHKMLSERKIDKGESLSEYFYGMKKLASQGNVEDSALFNYVIDGIRDLNVNKAMLYGANNVGEFKAKLAQYEIFSSKSKTPNETRPRLDVPKLPMNPNKENRKPISTCFNCGDKGHKSNFCPSKEKGQKCFNCNEFGHISKDCPNKKPEYTKKNTRLLQVTQDPMIMSTKIPQFTYKTLIDIGSEFNIMTEKIYNDLGRPNMSNTNVKLCGFGSKISGDNIIPLGSLHVEIKIDDKKYVENFLVVRPGCLDVPLLLGSAFCRNKVITIDENGVHFAKKLDDYNDKDEATEIMTINTQDEHEVNIDQTASAQAREEVIKLISNYEPKQTKSTNIEMKIILSDETPIASRANRFPLCEKRIIDEQIEKWIEDDIIEESESEFCSPIVLAKKRDGTFRLCIDYRKINKVIIKDRFPLPLIEDHLNKLQGANIYSTLDLKNGFFHVSVAENSRKYTAFISDTGLYQFKKVPFGLCNSPGVFQRYINAIFRELVRENVALPYIDDVIIPTKEEGEAVRSLQRVVKVCEEYGLQLNFKKCQFPHKRVVFLGYEIENQQISPSPRKVEALIKYKPPQTIRQVQSFLGLASYFRKFIPNFSIIAKPLSDMLKKDSKFEFNEEQQKSFTLLKNALCNKPVLSIFQQGLETEVHADASIDGFGAVLVQKWPDDGLFHPTYYMSKKTTEAERKYSSYELEILAVIEALKKFRIYLLGQHFKIVSDCKAFTKTLEKKDLCTRVARWSLLLEEYDYEVEHRAASRLQHADALSRYAVLTITEEDMLSKVKRAQEEDEELKAMIEAMQFNPSHNNYTLKNDILYKVCGGKELLVVPKMMQQEIIKKTHDRGHFGVQKVKELLEDDVYIPDLTNRIKRCISCCVPCIVVNRKMGKKEGQLHPLDKGDKPLCTYHADFIGPLDTTSKLYKHILVIVDAFTKFCWLYPTKTTSASCVITKLKAQNIIFGNPKTIVTDRGSAFTSEEFKDYCTAQNINHVKVTTGLPRANGQVERLNGVVGTVLAKMAVNEPTKWYKHVEYVQQCLNSTYSRSTGYTPFQLLTGVRMRLKEDLSIKQLIEDAWIESFDEGRNQLRKSAKEQILKVQQENRYSYNSKRKPATLYRIGDIVAIKRTQLGGGLKLRAKYLGPYRIIKAKSGDTYDVERVGMTEGPKRTTTCAEFIKPWADFDGEPFEAND